MFLMVLAQTLQAQAARNASINDAAGVLRCMAWAVEDKADGQPARCASYLITLAWDERAEAVTAHSVELLRRSKLPPHAVSIRQLLGGGMSVLAMQKWHAVA